jgi:hypothetical protein
MTTQNKGLLSQRLKWSKMLSVLTILVGIALLIYMITVEDEPGALPLLLITVGIGWFVANQYSIKKQL